MIDCVINCVIVDQLCIGAYLITSRIYEYVSARRPALTMLFHGQERNLAIEPSVWPAQWYETVYPQQFVKHTTCIRLRASSEFICFNTLCFNN